jgi:hypothetical protein
VSSGARLSSIFTGTDEIACHCSNMSCRTAQLKCHCPAAACKSHSKMIRLVWLQVCCHIGPPSGGSVVPDIHLCVPQASAARLPRLPLPKVDSRRPFPQAVAPQTADLMRQPLELHEVTLAIRAQVLVRGPNSFAAVVMNALKGIAGTSAHGMHGAKA